MKKIHGISLILLFAFCFCGCTIINSTSQSSSGINKVLPTQSNTQSCSTENSVLYNKKFIFRANADENQVSLTLSETGDFVLEEFIYENPFIVKITGTYIQQKDILILKVERNEIDERFSGYELEEIEFNIIDNQKLQLQTDLCRTKKGSVYRDESLFTTRSSYDVFGSPPEVLHNYLTEIKDSRQDSLSIFRDGTYLLYVSTNESPYSAMIMGEYVIEDGKFVLEIEYNGLADKFPEYDIDKVVFTIISETMLKLEVDLALTKSGTLFIV